MDKMVEVNRKSKSEDSELIRIVTLHKKVLDNSDGHSLLEFLMLDNHVLTGTFEPDPHVMAFREGQRSVVMSMLERLDIPMSTVRKMMDSAKDEYEDKEDQEEEQEEPHLQL